jgi:chemotaxis response regulator CheB
MALRILIVDDSEVTRRILSTILRSRHWTVCGEAENGGSGVEKFRKLKPDVVLSDLSLQRTEGGRCTPERMATGVTRVREWRGGVLAGGGNYGG